MKCPLDGTALVIADRSGIEIDYCPQCRGVWLDRGELDKLIERNSEFTSSHGAEENRHPQRNHFEKPGHKSHKKRESFLGELFDF